MKQKKFQLNFLKTVLILGLLILEGPCFAQNPENPAVTVDTEKLAETPHQEEHDTQDLEKLLKRYNTDQEKILEDANKLHTEAPADEVHDSEIEGMPHSEVVTEEGVVRDSVKDVYEQGMNSRKKPKVISSELSNSVRLALGPLQKLSEKELLERMDESTRNSPVRPYMDQFPNITIFAVRLIKDTESIPSIVRIFEDKDRLIWFASTMLCTVLLGFVLKKFMHREGRPFLKAVLYFFVRLYVMFAIRVGVVYYFYSAEFTPAARVFKSTFM